eukprot:1346385-Rhodomonas_salina.5
MREQRARLSRYLAGSCVVCANRSVCPHVRASPDSRNPSCPANAQPAPRQLNTMHRRMSAPRTGAVQLKQVILAA